MRPDERELEARLELEILPQPDDATCGPTCLHAVYSYFGDELELQQVIDEVETIEGGGTLAVLLALHALERGYQATIQTFNLQVFDPTWFAHDQRQLRQRLAAQLEASKDARVRVASRAFLRFLDLGGEVEFEDLTAGVLRHHLRRGLPVLTGLSATYLYRSVRERLTEEGRLVEDDLGGSPQGHFVVLCGYHTGERTVTVADPMFDNPMTPTHRYTVPIERLVNSILIGILTHDANLLVIQPRHTGKGPDAHPLRRRQS